jgi:hypothetical protein
MGGTMELSNPIGRLLVFWRERGVIEDPVRTLRHLIRVVPVLLAILFIAACNDDSSDLGDLTGVWWLTTTVTSDPCGVTEGGSDSDNIILIQCGDEVSIISKEGLWGIGTVQGENLDLDGTEVLTEESGCWITSSSTGTVSGTEELLEGFFTTTITFDSALCGDTPTCTVELSASLYIVEEYTRSCWERDEFGDPEDSEYILPWPPGKSYVLNNSYCIPTGGHREQQAYDFLIPVGDTLVAARAGIVRQVKETSPDDGQGTDHNHIMIEHTDGTTGWYAHLKQDGVLVEVGEQVEAGQIVALAGHSGTPDVVHLHFGVYATYPPEEGNDRAVNFRNAEGPLDCRGGLVLGATYTAE